MVLEDIKPEEDLSSAIAPVIICRFKQTIYLERTQLAQDVAERVWIDPRNEGQYQLQVRRLVIEAQAAGLIDVKNDLAFLVSEGRGRVAANGANKL